MGHSGLNYNFYFCPMGCAHVYHQLAILILKAEPQTLSSKVHKFNT